jgi:hypothetical protein
VFFIFLIPVFVSASAALFVGRQNKSWKGAAFTKVTAAPFENSAYDEARHAAGSLEAGGAAGVTGFVAAGAAAFLFAAASAAAASFASTSAASVGEILR